MTFSENYFTSRDGLRLYYRDYANASGKTPALCLPGVTRNSRDFDWIADRIARTRRVITADLRGRGRSQYDVNPENYLVTVETADIIELLTLLKIPRVIVLGTSRGGIIAMALATARPDMVNATIMNDTGPELETTGLARIAEVIGREPTYADWQVATSAVRHANASTIVNLPDADWETFTRARFRETDQGIVADYDPRLAETFRERTAIRNSMADLWVWFQPLVKHPMLVLRGENSNLLSAAGVEKMKAAKPDLIAVTVKDRGHVPFLNEPVAVAAIDAFLAKLD